MTKIETNKLENEIFRKEKFKKLNISEEYCDSQDDCYFCKYRKECLNYEKEG